MFKPTRKDIVKLFGPPTKRAKKKTSIDYNYRYNHPVISGEDQIIKIDLSFGKKKERIKAISIHFPDRSWQMDI